MKAKYVSVNIKNTITYKLIKLSFKLSDNSFFESAIVSFNSRVVDWFPNKNRFTFFWLCIYHVFPYLNIFTSWEQWIQNNYDSKWFQAIDKETYTHNTDILNIDWLNNYKWNITNIKNQCYCSQTTEMKTSQKSIVSQFIMQLMYR